MRKKTSTNSLLHAKSAHPKFLVHNIPTGQFLRLRRICSKEEFFEHQAKELHQRFRDRGYPSHTIRKAYHRAKRTDRKTLMAGRKKTETSQQAFKMIPSGVFSGVGDVGTQCPICIRVDTRDLPIFWLLIIYWAVLHNTKEGPLIYPPLYPRICTVTCSTICSV